MSLEQVLLVHHERFLEFVARRTGSRAEAEDVLHSAYLRVLATDLPEGEGAVRWFQRVLRNALVDAARRRGVQQRALEREAAEAHGGAAADELDAAICACVVDVLPALKPEYATLLRACGACAAHGCLDCGCRQTH